MKHLFVIRKEQLIPGVSRTGSVRSCNCSQKAGR